MGHYTTDIDGMVNFRIYFQGAAAIMVRRLGLAGQTAPTSFKDTDSIAVWAKNAVNAVFAKGIMGGYDDGTFRGASPITRAEAVVTLDIAGAISNTYKIVGDDAGKYIEAVAIGTDKYTGTVASPAAGPVAAKPEVHYDEAGTRLNLNQANVEKMTVMAKDTDIKVGEGSIVKDITVAKGAAGTVGLEKEFAKYSYDAGSKYYEVMINPEKNGVGGYNLAGTGLATGLINFLTRGEYKTGRVQEGLLSAEVIRINNDSSRKTYTREQLIEANEELSDDFITFFLPDASDLKIGSVIGQRCTIHFKYQLQSGRTYTRTEQLYFSNDY